MKKILPLIFTSLIFSCNNDDNTGHGSITITNYSTNHSQTKNENGMYMNEFGATVVNTTHTSVKGHVRFKIKEYGYIDSSSETVTNEKGHQKTFFATLETEKVIDKSYLEGAEFVME